MTGKLNATAVTEEADITFSDMAAGQSVSVGGLTLTAKSALSAAQVAEAFGNLTDTATTGEDPSSVDGTWSGRFNGFTGFYDANVNDKKITLTSTSTGTNVADVTVSSTGNLPDVSITQGAPAGSISFYKNQGSNASVISDDLAYVFTNSDTTAMTDINSRKISLAVDVAGSIPALRAGDLQINGIEIGASYATDDKVSPPNNAAGSAIAKAAAINRMAVTTGVTRGEEQMLTFKRSKNLMIFFMEIKISNQVSIFH